MYGKFGLIIFDILGYIGPFGPIPNFFRQTNHTNLTRRIDPRYPEPPNSVISSNIDFSFFRFLGFGEEGVRFLGFRGGVGSLSGFQGGEGELPAMSGDWPGAGEGEPSISPVGP